MLSKFHEFKNWKLLENKSHILRLEGHERDKFEEELKLPMYPDMIFNLNLIQIIHMPSKIQQKDNKIVFNVVDALKMVSEQSVDQKITVAAADVWQEANAHILNSDIVDKPNSTEKSEFDWTFTTKYRGTLTGSWDVKRTDDKINYEILKEKEPIMFYSEMSLFEDELGDNGCVQLMIRLRSMRSGFFLLQRFFLRIDDRMIRVFDTRLCCGAAIGSDEYVIREVRYKESSKWTEKMSGVGIMEAEEFCDNAIEHYCEKLTPL